MDVRLADRKDLPELKSMYKKIVDNMNRNQIPIWDEIYPCEFLEGDIREGRLYVSEKDGDIAAAFALCESNDGESSVKWESMNSKSLYIDRLGVNVKFLHQGTGGQMLHEAAKLAAEKNAEYLRLFVVDINVPAVNLYLKNGFRQVEGVYEENFDDFVLREYGFEKKL